MTLVCVRLDRSYATPRLTALADSRITLEESRIDGYKAKTSDVKIISDNVIKLFGLPVRCHDGDCLSNITGAYVNPYFETVIGLGYSGPCLEALCIIESFRRDISSLMCPADGRPLPSSKGIVNTLCQSTKNFFLDFHGTTTLDLYFVLFGFDQDKPWIATIVRHVNGNISRDQIEALPETLICIGNVGEFANAEETLSRIRKRQLSLEIAEDFQALDTEQSRFVEEQAKRRIEAEYIASVGGTLRRMELQRDVVSGRVISSDTADSQSIVERNSVNAADNGFLSPAPVTQRMGRLSNVRASNTTGSSQTDWQYEELPE